uniref:Tribbles pseudokinase 3 n=1 Tax=Callorhinchus milii TaxID=7868 RepID=A0A4W3H6S4_CALMI|eukprot:gi/632980139/ref/XP_007906865.1/ PREDICTED: tribbles homolog 3 [Callorhinchus milii]
MSIKAQRPPSPLPARLKRLDFDYPDDPDLPKCKRARLSQPSIPALTPCLAFPSPTPSPNPDTSVSRIGSYVLLNPTDNSSSYRAVHTHTEQEHVCKVFPMKRYHEVIAPYARLSPHPHVGRVADVITGERKFYAFFERGHGDMHTHVRSCKRLCEEEARTLFRQMVEAVAHCHGNGIVLRDLKLRKFVFTDKQRSKLRLENLEDAYVLPGEDDALTDKHGCPAYVGPEILNAKQSYSGRAADIWSLGVVLYTMLVGRYPFQDTEPAALFGKIRRGVYTVPDTVSPRAKCLIRCILRRNPAERLTAREILDHPWLNSSFTPAATISEAGGPPDQTVPDVYTEECGDL